MLSILTFCPCKFFPVLTVFKCRLKSSGFPRLQITFEEGINKYWHLGKIKYKHSEPFSGYFPWVSFSPTLWWLLVPVSLLQCPDCNAWYQHRHRAFIREISGVKKGEITQSFCSWWRGCRGLWEWTWGSGWQHLWKNNIKENRIRSLAAEVWLQLFEGESLDLWHLQKQNVIRLGTTSSSRNTQATNK